MTYVFATIISLLGGLAAWVYHLLQQNSSLKEKAASEAARSMIKEWNDKVKELDGKVKEDERDYEEKRDKFNSNNPGGSGAV